MSALATKQPERIGIDPVDRSGTVFLLGLVIWLGTMALGLNTAMSLGAAPFGIAAGASWLVLALGLAVGLPLLRSVRERRAGQASAKAEDRAGARKHRFRATQAGWIAAGYCLPLIAVLVFIQFLKANDNSVQRTFFDVSFMASSFKDIAIGFGQNVQIAIFAEILVLVWALLVALARLAPGQAGKPLRWLATAYIDAFRAVPSIIVIYLVGFGLPLAGIPVFSELGPFWSSVLALTLTYGAYVAEVYRAGIEGIHPSQVAASRSLGLSYGRTMRFVVVPQAVRRVVPPLLNDFIGLQKDTALVTIIGTVDAFTQAKIFASNHFNLSSVTVVAVLFILITIPQTRFVDRLIDRDQRARSRS